MKIGEVISAMIDYFDGDLHEIEHFMKVYSYAKAICECEEIDAPTREIIEIASVVHDIGIPKAREVYHSDAGKYQEELGPAEARELLTQLSCDPKVIERVCFLVGCHHTYRPVEGIDHRVLLEADFLVNASQSKYDKAAVLAAKQSFFRTKTGTHYLETCFGV